MKQQWTPRAKRWFILYPALLGTIFAVRLCLPRELDEQFLAEASGLGACVIGVMVLSRQSAGK